jgi:hypothetical protein
MTKIYPQSSVSGPTLMRSHHLALFPELVVDHGIALEFFEFEEGEQPTHTPPNDNIIYLR